MKKYVFTIIMIILTILYVSLAATTDFTSIQLNMFKNNSDTVSKTNRAQLYATYLFGYLLSILLVVYELIYLSIDFKDYFILRLIQFIIVITLIILSIISNIFVDDTVLVKISHILQPLVISLWIILSSCFKSSILPKIKSSIFPKILKLINKKNTDTKISVVDVVQNPVEQIQIDEDEDDTFL